jgi:hypothetical protein
MVYLVLVEMLNSEDVTVHRSVNLVYTVPARDDSTTTKLSVPMILKGYLYLVIYLPYKEVSVTLILQERINNSKKSAR